MLGLQTTYDVNTTLRLRAAANSNSNLSASGGGSHSIRASDVKNSRSWKFSNHLYKAGFDNVVGQSSSLEKHAKLQKGTSPAEKERKRRTNVVTKLAHEQFVDMQDQHAVEDAERLKEVQNKLEDLRRRKEARIRRERSRRQRKVQFMAARKIQYFFKFVMLDAKERAAKILRNFVRKVVNRNAISVASWASGVIARFAKYATLRWKTLKVLRGLSSGMAEGMWESLGGRAVAEIAGRKMVAKFVAFQSLRQGLTLVARKKIAQMRELSRKKKKEQRWGKARGVKKVAGMMSSPKKSPTSPSSKSPSPKGDRRGDKFFSNSEDSDSSHSQVSPPQTKDTVEGLVQEAKRNFVDPSHIPAANPSDVNASQTDLSSMGMSMMDMDMNFDLAADLSEDEYDEDEELEKEHREQMRQAHMAKQAAQERERQARLRAIERAKAQREEEERERRMLERMRLEAAEQARQEWLDTQDAIRERRSKKITRTRKFRAKEEKREAREQILMTAEDTMVPKAKQSAWVPGTIPKQKKKKEREPTEFELEMAMEREEEEARLKEEAAQKLYELNKENTEARLRKKKEHREKEAEEKEKEEIARKEKMERLKESTEAARVRAAEAKKIADMHAKQRQKEMDAVDAADKMPRGRTHNASGKPVLKGFLRPEDRQKVKKSKKGIAISSKMAVRDPTVRQWNYEVEPADGDRRTAEEPIDGLREYNEFLSAAEEHTLDEVDVITGDDYWPFGEESNDEHGDLEESLGSDLDWGRSREDGDEGDEVQLGEVVQKKPSSAELQPGGARKKKSKQKASVKGIPTKATVVEIAGVTHKKKVVIPPKLKDSAYFKSYKSVKKAEMAAEASADVENDTEGGLVLEETKGQVVGEEASTRKKPRKKVRRGKVATMLEMINKARKKLEPEQHKSASNLPAPGSDINAGASSTSQLLASKSNPMLQASPDSFSGKFASQTAPMPHFPSPPKIADFSVEVDAVVEDLAYGADDAPPPEMIQEELGDEVRNGEPMSGSLEQYYFASKEASIEGAKGFSTADFPPSRNQTIHSPIDVEPPTQERTAPVESMEVEEETAEAREERRQEEALNAECDQLLLRLEKRLGVSSGQGKIKSSASDANEENENPVQKATKVPFPSGIPVAAKSLAPKAPQGMSKKLPKTPTALADTFKKGSSVDSYIGDYSIGVDLPSFSLPVDGAQAKVLKRNQNLNKE